MGLIGRALFVLLFLAGLPVAGFATESMMPAKENTYTLVAGRGGDHPPYAWIDNATGAPVGFVYRMLEIIADELGVEFETRYSNFRSESEWQKTEQELKAGLVDVIAGISPADELDLYITTISEPLFTLEYHLITLIGREKLHQLGSLKGLSLAVVGRKGGVDKRFKETFPEAEFTAFSSRVDAYGAVQDKTLDGWLSPYYSSLAFIRVYNTEKNVYLGEKIYLETPVYLAVSKSSPLHSRIDEIEQLLHNFKTDDRYQMIRYQMMGTYIRQVTPNQ